jgi:hypothetical protein
MAKRKVIWTDQAIFEMFEIMNYYANRNKSKTYSIRLHAEIKQNLKKLDFSIALPQKTSKTTIFYFTHKHISIFFSIENDDIFVKSISDERRDPNDLKKLLANID